MTQAMPFLIQVDMLFMDLLQGGKAAPDYQRLVDVSLRGECNDVVAAAQLGEWMRFGILLQLHAALA